MEQISIFDMIIAAGETDISPEAIEDQRTGKWIGVIWAHPDMDRPSPYFFEAVATHESYESAKAAAKKRITELRKMSSCLCLWAGECDCANPPPDDWDGGNGIWGISNECPTHNYNPNPNPECPIHGDDHE
jgi:hypothetical protein